MGGTAVHEEILHLVDRLRRGVEGVKKERLKLVAAEEELANKKQEEGTLVMEIEREKQALEKLRREKAELVHGIDRLKQQRRAVEQETTRAKENARHLRELHMPMVCKICLRVYTLGQVGKRNGNLLSCGLTCSDPVAVLVVVVVVAAVSLLFAVLDVLTASGWMRAG